MYSNFVFLDRFLFELSCKNTHTHTHTQTHTHTERDSNEYAIVVFSKNATIKIMTRFRVSNHRLPVELLRYTGIDREQRVCHKCNENVIGDEIHYLLFCPYFKNQRQSLIGLYL